MKNTVLILILFLTGCAANLVYAPLPKEPVSMQEASVAAVVLKAQGLSFTLISRYDGGKARMIVLADPMFKLIDAEVSEDKIQVYYKAPRLPKSHVIYWAHLVQKYFMTPCPPRHIVDDAGGSKSWAELNVTGGVCP